MWASSKSRLRFLDLSDRARTSHGVRRACCRSPTDERPHRTRYRKGPFRSNGGGHMTLAFSDHLIPRGPRGDLVLVVVTDTPEIVGQCLGICDLDHAARAVNPVDHVKRRSELIGTVLQAESHVGGSVPPPTVPDDLLHQPNQFAHVSLSVGHRHTTPGCSENPTQLEGRPATIGYVVEHVRGQHKVERVVQEGKCDGIPGDQRTSRSHPGGIEHAQRRVEPDGVHTLQVGPISAANLEDAFSSTQSDELRHPGKKGESRAAWADLPKALACGQVVLGGVLGGS